MLRDLLSNMRAWRIVLLVVEYLIWFARPAWMGRGHHFEFGFIVVIIFGIYLYLLMGWFLVELFFAISRFSRVSKTELLARAVALLLAVTPSMVFRVLKG